MSNGKNAGLDVGLLILRLALGAILIVHGYAKLTTIGPSGLADYLGNKLGILWPLPMAYACLLAEIGGGALVILGLFARIGALAIAVTMGVAIAKVHWPKGFFLKLKAEGLGDIPHGYEYCLALLAMALCIVFAGSGKIRVPVGKGP